MEGSNIKHTAIHEAGHAIAHVRIDVLKDQTTIDPGEGILGSSTPESIIMYGMPRMQQSR